MEATDASGVNVIFNRVVKNKESIVVGGPNSNSGPTPIIVFSYFDPSISFSVMATEPMQVIGRIQAAKKSQFKIESWDSIEVFSRLQAMRDYIIQNAESIAGLEAHFQGTTRIFQMRWTIGPLVALFDQLLQNSVKLDQYLSKGLIGAITPQVQSFYEIGCRVALALFHKDALVLKPATKGALSALIWEDIFKICDIPEGLMAFVYGDGASIGRLLMDHPGIKNISFSGAFETMKTVSLSIEKKYQFFFNGKNAVAILSDFNPDRDMLGFVRLLVEHNGKSVFSPARVFVLDSMENKFKANLFNYLSSIKNLNSIDDEFGFLPLRNSEKNQLSLIKAKFLSEGGKTIFENERFLFFSDVPNCSELHQDGLELPVFDLASVKYSYEMPKWANNSPFGHSFFIFGSADKAIKLIQKAEVANIFMNPNPLEFKQGIPAKSSSFGDVRFDLPHPFYCYPKS